MLFVFISGRHVCVPVGREISIVSNPAYKNTRVRELDLNLEENQENIDNENNVEREVVARKIAILKTRV